MEPKDDVEPPSSQQQQPPPPPPEREEAQAILKGFLHERGVVVNDDGLDGIAAGLQALLGGGSDEEEEAEEAEAGKKAPAFVMETYKRQRPQEGPEELVLSLASSHHSLWGHRLWNASIVLGEMIDDSREIDVAGKSCLELGAGAALPSLLAGLNGARRVVASDYASSTDRVLVDAIQQNIGRLEAGGHVDREVLHPVGYVWGQDVGPLLAPLEAPEREKRFDIILCADLIFNRSEHAKLLRTCAECVAPEGGQVLVAYSHHDPGKAPLDLRFFELATAPPFSFIVEDVKVEQRVDLFVEGDGLDEERGKVYVKRLRLPSAAAAAGKG